MRPGEGERRKRERNHRVMGSGAQRNKAASVDDGKKKEKETKTASNLSAVDGAGVIQSYSAHLCPAPVDTAAILFSNLSP